MKKTLALHIGSHKTATTYIQGALTRNDKVLEGAGLLYPTSGRAHNAHFRLSGAVRANPGPLEDLPHWPQLFDEIDAAEPDLAVLSSEEFSFKFNPARLEALKKRYDVRIVYFLRSPDSFVESFYNQLVKDFSTRETRFIDSYVCDEHLHYLEASRILRAWADVFGRDAITVRLFGRQFLPDGVLPAFFDALDFSAPSGLAPPGDAVLQKVSLPPDALEFLRVSNRWPTGEAGHYDYVVNLVKAAERHHDCLQATRSGILSHKARRNLRLRFAQSHRDVARTHLGTDAVPFPAAEAPPPPADFEARLREASPDILARVAMLFNAEDADVPQSAVQKP